MPEVVKLCVRSIKKNAPKDSKIHVITLQNMNRYVTFPEYIYKKVNAGTLTLTHLSDMLRFELLYRYGGLWIDSTVFVSDKIAEKYFELPFYSVKQNGDNLFYSYFTSFLIGGQKGNPIFQCMLDFFYEYQKRYERLIEGHWINLWFGVMYQQFENVRKQNQLINEDNCDFWRLIDVVNDEYREGIVSEVFKNQIYHKLNWRMKYRDDGKSIFSALKKRDSLVC